MDYSLYCKNYLADLKTEGRYRVFNNIERIVGEAPYALWRPADGSAAKKIIVCCSNDYLGLSHHPEIIEAATEAINKWGVGSGGTRNISGTADIHVQLENSLAEFHQKESALIFTSGFVANEASLAALGEGLPNCVILSDEKNHASIIHGIRFGRSEKRIFKHSNLKDLEEQLSGIPLETPKVIVFVSVYSMDGDIAPIKEISRLAKKYNALTYLDEVHAVGLYGKNGSGLAEKQGVAKDIDIIQGNFAKGFGVVGGYITGKKEIIDFIRSRAGGFIFTTSLPPAVAMSALKSIEVSKKSDALRKTLHSNCNYFKEQISKTNIPTLDSESHISLVMVRNANLCKKASDMLLEKYGFYLQPINYPTVPKGEERLRVTITPQHTTAMIDSLVKALDEIWEELKLPREELRLLRANQF